MSLPVFRDKHGLEIFHYNKAETRFVYKEVFEDRVYFRHGIALRKGDCVWDIGANIGMFTIFLQQNFEDIRVHAFEPSPRIYEILQANTGRYGDRVVTHRCGIAGADGDATFTFYPSYSIMSGFHAQEDQDGQTLRAGIRNEWQQRYPQLELDDENLEARVGAALGQKEEYQCHLRTVSGLLDETGAGEIALLKIDAEGSELDILSGIRDEHWPLIRQIVTEIHPGPGSAIPKILEERGFQVALEEESGLLGSGVVNCYAIRPPVGK